jgi:Cu/Ag efflux pump CusA
MRIRSAVVVIAALPLAMLIAFILIQQAGLSANLMSLAGLAIGIGMMVDGAVVMVENGYRLLNHRKQVDSRSAVILEAAREVANPVAFAILIIIVVFRTRPRRQHSLCGFTREVDSAPPDQDAWRRLPAPRTRVPA